MVEKPKTGPSGTSDGGPRRPALDRSRPLRLEDSDALRLRRQWVVTQGSDAPPVTWPKIDLGHDLVLHHHPEARVTSGQQGSAGALTIGVAVSTSVTVDHLSRHLAELGLAEDATVDRFLYDLCGTYVLIRHGPAGVTVYTDPAGMMSVYRGNGRVASSPTLLGDLERNRDLDREFLFGPDNDWYPWTLTPFEGVSALPANHALDVRSGHTRRFWPTAPPSPVSAEDGVHRVADLLRLLAGRVLDLGPVVCSLTGGKDSRLNLAALGTHHPQVEFFTVHAPSTKACDRRIPLELASRFGLDHTVVEAGAAPSWLLSLYDEISSGLAIGGRREIVEAGGRIGGPDYIHLNGNLGGVMKSYFWHSRRPRQVRERALSKEFTAPSPRIEAALGEWLGSLPNLPPPTVYNLMYLEQRAGRWAGAGETASGLFYDSVTLLASREILDTIATLPTDTQYGGRLPVDLTRILWPELLDIPYCTVRRNWSTYLPRRTKTRLKQLTGHG